VILSGVTDVKAI